MPAVLRQVCLRYDWTSIDKKNQMNNNNNNGACQHTDFFACSASFAKFLLNDHASWCSSVQVFSWKISQGHFMTKYSQTRNHQLFPSVLNCKHLSSNRVKGCSSSSWVAAYLQSGRLCQLRRKRKVTILTLHSDQRLFFILTPYRVYSHYIIHTVFLHKDVATSSSVDLAGCASACSQPLPSFFCHFQASWTCSVCSAGHSNCKQSVRISRNAGLSNTACQLRRRRLDALLDHLYRSREDQEGMATLFSRVLCLTEPFLPNQVLFRSTWFLFWDIKLVLFLGKNQSNGTGFHFIVLKKKGYFAGRVALAKDEDLMGRQWRFASSW